MPVLPEERVISYLGRCLELSRELLPSLGRHGTEEVEGEGLQAFTRLIDELRAERENDSYLSDEAWDWIWKGRPSYNYLQLYGRLAWINQQLFDLL